MNVSDFQGECQVRSAEELLARLKSVRRGVQGAFILDHGGGPSLWVHFNGDAAFLWFCPMPPEESDQHPGFVADGMWSGEQREMSFPLLGGNAADDISVAWRQLLPPDAAYAAAVEFFHSPALPPSISWFDLSSDSERRRE